MRALAPVMAVLTALAVLLVANPAQASPSPRTTKEAQYARAVFHKLNDQRTGHGQRPLWRCSMLNLSSRRHDWRMAQADTLSHQLPGEPWVGRREVNAGYYWVWTGENIGWNSAITQAGAVYLERLMLHSAEHRANILSTHYRAVGVDVLIDPAHHKLWLTVDFGRRY